MFSVKETFAKKYPLLDDIFDDEEIRKNLMNNQDFATKYQANNSLIKIFLFELKKRFEIDVIRHIVIETILKLPSNLLVSFITSYLNSDETTKSNPEVVEYYNRTSNLGVGVMYYMQENGIVSNRKYKELPYLVLDDKFKRLNKSSYGYEEEDEFVPLSELYERLTYPEREVLVELLENSNFDLISQIFKQFDYGFKVIIGVLYSLGIDSRLINDNVVNTITPYNILLLLYMLLDMERSELALLNIYKLIDANRLELLNKIIINGLVNRIGEVEYQVIENMNDEGIINKLKSLPVTLAKKDE